MICTDRFEGIGPEVYYNASAAAGWYSAVCAIIASAALIGIQVRLGRHDRARDLPALLTLLCALVVAMLGAFVNAAVSGEYECNIMTARLTVSGSFVASAGMLIFLALSWTIAELGVHRKVLQLVHYCVTIIVVLAVFHVLQSISYQSTCYGERRSTGGVARARPLAAHHCCSYY